MPSATCLINGSSSLGGANVGAGTTVTIALADVGGVSTWSLTCIGTDETNAAATVTSGLSINQVSKTATFTAPAAGSALVFQSQINGGRDINGNVVQAYTTTFAVFVTLSNGLRVGAINETTEGDATFGWATKVNSYARQIGGGSAGTFSTLTLSASPLQFTSTVATPTINQADVTTNSATGQVLTLQAQNATGTTSTGGKLSLRSGSGTSANGVFEFKSGATTLGTSFLNGGSDWRFALDSGLTNLLYQANGTNQNVFFQALGVSGGIFFQSPQIIYADGSTATTATWALNATGATSLTFATGITGLTIKQADKTTNSGTGATTTIQAQNETGTTSVGGDLTLTSGTGTSTHGAVRLQVGGNTRIHTNNTGIGFYGASPVAQQTRAGQLTGAFGSTGTAIVDVGAAFSQSTLNNNFRVLEDAYNRLETIVHNLGLST